jgi:hypothetical protein
MCPKSICSKELRQVWAARLSLSAYGIRTYVYLLENRTITTNTIHDTADTVQAYTLAHVLYKCSRITVSSN